MAKHTPGPWKWVRESGGEAVDLDGFECYGFYDNPVLISPSGECVISAGEGEYCPIVGLGDEENGKRAAANARVIEAAPDMVNELEGALAALRNPDGISRMVAISGISALLTRIKGEA